MFGFEPELGYAHLTSGGHIANFEGLWIARNLKQFPFALKNHYNNEIRNIVERRQYNDRQLLNMSTKHIIELIEELKDVLKKNEMIKDITDFK